MPFCLAVRKRALPCYSTGNGILQFHSLLYDTWFDHSKIFLYSERNFKIRFHVIFHHFTLLRYDTAFMKCRFLYSSYFWSQNNTNQLSKRKSDNRMGISDEKSCEVIHVLDYQEELVVELNILFFIIYSYVRARILKSVNWIWVELLAYELSSLYISYGGACYKCLSSQQYLSNHAYFDVLNNILLYHHPYWEAIHAQSELNY